MGVYLSSPIRDKISEDDESAQLRYGASSMQGWRTSQEDAHNCCPNFDPEANTALFACYDGHGGAEVAQYTAQHFPEFLKALDVYKANDLSKALVEAFLSFDATLKEDAVVQKLKELAGVDDDEESEGNQEEPNALYEEATMPLEELLSRYGRGGATAASALKKNQKFQSPVICARKENDVKPVVRDDIRMKLENELMNGHSDNENNENIERASQLQAAMPSSTASSSSAVPSRATSIIVTQTTTPTTQANEAQAKEEKESKPFADQDGIADGSSCVDSTTSDDPTHKEAAVRKIKAESDSSLPQAIATTAEPLAAASSSVGGEGDAESSSTPTTSRLKTATSDSSVNGTDSQPSSTTTSCTAMGQEEPGSSSSSVGAGGDSVVSAGFSSTVSAGSSAAVSAGLSSTVSEGSSSTVSTGSSYSVSAGSSSSSSSSSSSQSAAPESSSSSAGGSSGSAECSSNVEGSEETGPCSSSKQEPEAGSSTGRTRSKRKNVIPEEGEDESSFDEDSSDDEDDEDEEEGAEPWASGSGDSSDEDVMPGICEDDDEEDEEEEEEEDENAMTGGEEPGADSGCTSVVALLRGKELYVANAGDSRCVLCRGGKAHDMSIDHKPEDEIEHSRITKAGGRVTMDGRVNGGLNLSRAIGDHCYKRNLTLSDREQMITALPDIKTATLEETDTFMVLACDGIWNVMTSQDVVNFVSERLKGGVTKLSSICEEMFDFCLSPDTSGDGTGCDNMTCMIVCFKHTAEQTTTVSDNVSVKRLAESTDKTDLPESKRAKTEAS